MDNVTEDKDLQTQREEIMAQCEAALLKPIVANVVALINELDGYKQQFNDSNEKVIIDYCQNRLIETLLQVNGISSIDDAVYDVQRNTIYPYYVIANGTPIKNTKRVGLIYNGKVLLKSIVAVEQNTDMEEYLPTKT